MGDAKHVFVSLRVVAATNATNKCGQLQCARQLRVEEAVFSTKNRRQLDTGSKLRLYTSKRLIFSPSDNLTLG